MYIPTSHFELAQKSQLHLLSPMGPLGILGNIVLIVNTFCCVKLTLQCKEALMLHLCCALSSNVTNIPCVINNPLSKVARYRVIKTASS